LENNFDLEKYLTNGVEKLVKNALKASLRNPKESAFLLNYAGTSKKSAELRHQFEVKGEHIPAFLIASVTSDCNLRCAGCYARIGQNRAEGEQFSGSDWKRVFAEAGDLGVVFILLAGGEPLLRRDVITEAAKHKKIIFPVFTNATLLDAEYLKLFDNHRNLIPIVSIEGNEAQTDTRRGSGIYKKTIEALETLKNRNLLFGISITVTNKNLATVTNAVYIELLRNLGCKIALFIEYVPFEAAELALDVKGREYLSARLASLRITAEDMIIVSFPGDEQETSGCLATGRGFFHINASGGAEPCPFSQHSDTNLKNVTLRQALQSPLFVALRTEDLLRRVHNGGCTLFEYDDKVLEMLKTQIVDK
jgi:MoaA/NifB/PqqE/SkfB family radical SAM enzyme